MLVLSQTNSEITFNKFIIHDPTTQSTPKRNSLYCPARACSIAGIWC